MRLHELMSLALVSAILGCGVGPAGTAQGPAQDHAPGAPATAAANVQPPGGGSPSCAQRPVRDVQLARDVEPILLSGCSGEFCHRLTSASRAYAFLVDQPSVECDDSRPLVTPGDPERSYVVDKILGRNLCAGHPMPRGLENRLSADEIRTVTDWICDGARND